MKKFLSFFLAALMVLSLATNIVFSVGAEEVADQPQCIKVPLDGPWTECWAEELEGTMTQTRIYYLKPGPHGAGGFMFSYGENNKAAAVDISGMKYLEFDVYVSDPSIMAEVEFSFELTSGGTADKQESAKKFKGKDTGWVQGWNHVKWELTEFNSVTDGGLDATKWNYIRWYNDTALSTGDWFQVAIKNILFTTENYVPAIFDIVYDLDGGYNTIEQLGDAFLADFNKYGETNATKENFQGDSSAPVKVALANAEMLAKWNWLWVYMLDHLKETNPDATSKNITDTYPVLEKMIAGDTTAILDSANARTSIRSYIHGFLNSMKGCGEINTDFSKFSPDFSSTDAQAKLLAQQGEDKNVFGAYATIEQLGDAFLADFNKYGETTATKENFQGDSSAPVKVALANAEMLEKWEWLWIYMLAHLKQENAGVTNANVTDAYTVLEKMIAGDTTAILDNANARTAIRSYIHGFLNSMKGCGDINTDFSKFSPDFSSEAVRENFMNCNIAVTFDEDSTLMVPVRNGYTFEGWKNEKGEIVTEVTAGGTLTAAWKSETEEPEEPETPDEPETPEEPDDGSIKIPLDGPWDQCWAEEIEGILTQTRIYYNKPGPHGAGGFMFRYGEGGSAEPVDISGMKYLEFDVYVSDPAIIAEVEFSFELTSSGTSDKEESTKKFKGKDTGWVQGWNHVKWKLAEFDQHAEDGLPMDATRWNFIRWFNESNLDATNWFQIGIKDIKFTTDPVNIDVPLDGPWDQCWAEELEGILTQTRIYYNKPGPHGPGGFMFRYGEGGSAEAIDISGKKYLEFDVFVSDPAIIAEVEFSFELTSSGTSDKEESAKKFKGKDTGWVQGWNHVKWDLAEFDVKNGEFDPTRWNFIRWYNDTDLNATNWLQIAIKDMKFTPKTAEDLDYEEEAATEHAVPIWGANTPWDSGDYADVWEVDTKNKMAGSASISYNLKNRFDWVTPEKHFEYPIDATGMDTLEFDLYLSDLAIVEYFSNTDGAIELSSAGTCDQAEVQYNFRNLCSNKLDEAVVGWNHIVIPIKNMEKLDGAAGAFDISAVNYLRIYWVHPKACDEDWIVKFDNIRLTDAQKQIDDAKEQEAQQILAKYADLIAKIDTLKDLTEVTDANYATVKAQYDEVRAAYDAVPVEEQTIIAGKGYAEKLMIANKLIESYEKDLAILEANKDLIAALKALEVYKTSGDFTAENYADAKAAIEAARKAVDELERVDRNLLKDKGYIAILENAEKALPKKAPVAPNTSDPNTTDKKGCGSALTVGAVATMALAGAWVSIAARKKED